MMTSRDSTSVGRLLKEGWIVPPQHSRKLSRGTSDGTGVQFINMHKPQQQVGGPVVLKADDRPAPYYELGAAGLDSPHLIIAKPFRPRAVVLMLIAPNVGKSHN
jgi:hypothetical protein